MTAPTAALARIAQATGYDTGKIELVKDTIARGASDDELMLFLHLAKRSGLDPFSRQIYLIERRANVNGEWKTTRQPQTGIDGLRLIADRTDHYAPGREPSFTYDMTGALLTATAYVKKFVRGEWHEVAATAHYDEYVQRKKDGQPNQMWGEKPHIMLAKCAEALALRRAFPAEMSGLYTADEIRAESDLPPTVVDVHTGEIVDAPAATKRSPSRQALLERIDKLSLAAAGLDLEIILAKPLDVMSEAELMEHGRSLRAAVDAAQVAKREAQADLADAAPAAA
jgi:phage recombination protein Bet